MTNIKALAGLACGVANPPGTTTKLYITCKGELTGMPDTRFAVVTAAAGTPADGDTKIYDEAWDFSAAPSDKGYWREIDIKIKTGLLEDILEGEVGGQASYNQLDFEIIGDNAVQREWYDELVALSGCGIAMIKDKKGNHLVLGDIDNPFEVLAGSKMSTGKALGDARGITAQLKSETGFTSMIYDADMHGVDLTPNP